MHVKLWMKESLDVKFWKAVANDLWWRLDNLDGDEAAYALEDWPELGETEEYLAHLVGGVCNVAEEHE